MLADELKKIKVIKKGRKKCLLNNMATYISYSGCVGGGGIGVGVLW